jgi:hypothetical protein
MPAIASLEDLKAALKDGLNIYAMLTPLRFVPVLLKWRAYEEIRLDKRTHPI